jgi:putative ABC transport system substrate-binding protein
MKRREFITLIGGAAAWPAAAQTQQAERKRLVGVLVPLIEDDAFAKKQVGAFITELGRMGWIDGGNARVEVRWAGPTSGDIRRHAAELIAVGPDVVLPTARPRWAHCCS